MKEQILLQRDGAMGPLMGVVIKELGGGADGKIISKLLSERLRETRMFGKIGKIQIISLVVLVAVIVLFLK